MSISPRRLPRLLGILVIAFAAYEQRPLLGAVELFPGMAIRLVHRWITGHLVADSHRRAVLLWSEAFQKPTRRLGLREVVGVLAATATGVVIVILSSLIIVCPGCIVMAELGVAHNVIAGVVLFFIVVRLLIVGVRAIRTYREKLALTARLPSPTGLRWRIDFLAAVPSNEGFGGHLLEEFLDHADECGAEVVLHCDDRNVSFYRHFGFHLIVDNSQGGQRLMLRLTRAVRNGRSKRAKVTGNRRTRS
jgi:GNAT superfamily N-acetyltransferase